MENFLLSLDRKKQIKMLEDALLEDRFDIFKNLSKILLDAPIDKGGLPTDVVSAIFKKYQKTY
jgi:hypothetical protein|tara:strand:+ start:299 stop:487 length:189 start_codon:yes stop_codon:yes gene_type:complete